MLIRLDHFPKEGDEHKQKYIRNHHLGPNHLLQAFQFFELNLSIQKTATQPKAVMLWPHLAPWDWKSEKPWRSVGEFYSIFVDIYILQIYVLFWIYPGPSNSGK